MQRCFCREIIVDCTAIMGRFLGQGAADFGDVVVDDEVDADVGEGNGDEGNHESGYEEGPDVEAVRSILRQVVETVEIY